MRIWFCKT